MSLYYLFFFTLDCQDKFLEILDCSFYTVCFVKLRKIMEMFKQILLPFFGIFALTVLVCAQDQSGFISLDCGLPRDNNNYTEATTGINYISDAYYIETGSGKSILPEYKVGKQQQMWFIRSFPEGIRNCYRLNLSRGDKYLIRTYFMYGNYDDANIVPSFDLYIGPNFWKTLNFKNASTVEILEIIHVLQSDYLHFCLVNTGKGTPFISALELRLLKNTTYITQSGSLELDTRADIGSTLDQIYRYKDDVYDRIWLPYNFVKGRQLNALGTIDENSNNGYEPARKVMNTAATPVDADQPLDFSLNPSDSSTQYYIYMHFAEVVKLRANQSRAFNISLNGQHWYGPFSPSYLSTTTVFTKVGLSAGLQNNFSIYKTESSTLPPILNAVEIYTLKEFLQLQTEEQDVDAITNIKATYGLKKNWQGDPCVPRTFLWNGLSCSNNSNDQPRITSLNLSSSGLSGGIADYLSNLTMLESLDLSNNNLSGPVPEFLSQLSSLKVLNLERNKLTGLIPAALLDLQKNNSLSLSFDGNPDLCSSDPCKKKNKKKSRVVIAVVASVAAFVVVLAALIGLWVLKRRKQQVNVDPKSSKMYNSLEKNKQQFTYSNVLKMTNNFERVLGKGGFGTVYYGRLDDTEVAVKMLSQSSAQGFKQFQSEVKLLMRVHHKDLTTLIGFCEEGTNLALIYEYMANGNLGEHLLDNDKDILNWETRLRMAVEAAQGLEYLHHGCKPPIIHRDVKSTNILLNDKFQAKLADFGLSRTFLVEGDTHVSTVVAGTPGYLDPEYYMSNRLTEKSDVYSFGVVLLELITGKPIILKSLDNSNSHISQWVSFNLAKGDIRSTVDPRMKGEFNINSVWKAVEIAMACVSQTSSRRPTMNHVMMELNECLATETAWRKENANEFETGDSVEMMTVNFHNDLSPQAR